MAMNFEELDGVTRQRMLTELDAELAGPNPYLGRGLSVAGRAAFPALMREAIQGGNEESLAAALNRADYWNPTESYERNGVTRERQVNVRQAAERLALTEFNTWYVRGLARRLLATPRDAIATHHVRNCDRSAYNRMRIREPRPKRQWCSAARVLAWPGDFAASSLVTHAPV